MQVSEYNDFTIWKIYMTHVRNSLLGRPNFIRFIYLGTMFAVYLKKSIYNKLTHRARVLLIRFIKVKHGKAIL